MLDILKSLGAEPHLRGVATIGGVLSLIVLLITLSYRAWKSRDFLLKPVKRSKARRGRADIIEYFSARKMKREGMSDLFIGSHYFQKVIHKVGAIVFEVILLAANYSAYVGSDQQSSFYFYLSLAFALILSYDIFAMRSAWDPLESTCRHASLSIL